MIMACVPAVGGTEYMPMTTISSVASTAFTKASKLRASVSLIFAIDSTVRSRSLQNSSTVPSS